MPTFTIDRSDPARRVVTWSDIGPAGHLEPIDVTPPRMNARPRTHWVAVTPAGLQSPTFDRQFEAVWWLHHQAVPVAPAAPVEPPDPVLALIERYQRSGQSAAADAAVLACIARDIAEMTQNRMRHNPPALWQHLDRFQSWLDALNATPAPAAADTAPPMHPRFADLLETATRR